MAEETLEVTEHSEEPKGDPRSNVQSRINEVLQKATAAEEARKKAEAERDSLAKEASFYKSFNPLLSKYQAAAELQDKIKEKVMAGYDIEDATVAILNREGKLNPQAPVVERETVAGGSATNPPTTGKAKPVGEMSQSERWAKLYEMEKKGDYS